MFLLCSKTSTIQQYNNVDWLLRDLSCFRPEGKTSSVSELLGSIYASWSLLGPCFRSSLKLLRPGHGKEQHMCSCSSLQYVFPCVTYPKDVSNETAVTVTIRVLVVQFMFISIKNTVPMDRFSWQTRCLNFFQFGTLVKQIQEHMLHKEWSFVIDEELKIAPPGSRFNCIRLMRPSRGQPIPIPPTKN